MSTYFCNKVQSNRQGRCCDCHCGPALSVFVGSAEHWSNQDPSRHPGSSLIATQWMDPATGARIERTSRTGDKPSYAVRFHGNCLSRDGEWEWEPQPSSRDQEFLESHRWSDLGDAEKALLAADSTIFGSTI
jgi:hypothetical protein